MLWRKLPVERDMPESRLLTMGGSDANGGHCLRSLVIRVGAGAHRLRRALV
jgi:hypothetical protein